MTQIYQNLYNTIVQAYASIESSLNNVEVYSRMSVDAIIDVTTFDYPDSTPSVADADAALEIENVLLIPFNIAYISSLNISGAIGEIIAAVQSLNNFVIRNSSFAGTNKEKLDNWINVEMVGYWLYSKAPATWLSLCEKAGYNVDDWDSRNSVNLTSAMVAQYKMNDNTDTPTVVNEYGVDGTYIGGNPSVEDTSLNSVPGVINNALTFDGVSSYIDTNQTFMSTFQSEFTISLWVNITETIPAGDHKCFIGVESVSGSQVDITQSNAGILTISYLVQGNGGGVSTGIPAFSTTGPHHVVCSVSQASVSPTQDIRYQIYIDGVLRKDTIYEDLGILMSNYDNSTVNLSIGRYAYNLSGFYYFDSFIDDVRIFNRVLTQDEVDFLYNSGNGTEGLLVTI